MTAHKHAALMLQYAQDAAETDKPWERWEYKNGYRWCTCSRHLQFDISNEYRRKPQMMRATCADGTVVEWPEPMREAPEVDTFYFRPYINVNENCFYNVRWKGDSIDMHALRLGLVHETPEAAKMHAQALMALSYGSANWEQES